MNPHAFYKNLGRWLRTTRDERGLTLEETGKHLHVAPQQIQKYESGINRIPVDKLLLFCRLTRAKIMSALRAAEGHRSLGEVQ